MQNELARTIDYAGLKVQYDMQCKKVLAQKEILSRILKGTMEEFHIPMHNEMEKEVNVMCNLSDLVEEKGIEKGVELMIKALLKNGKVSDADIAEAAEISMEQLEMLKKRL